jgi:hypothetical protein
MGLEFEAICQWWWTTREYEGGRGFSGFTDLKVEDDDFWIVHCLHFSCFGFNMMNLWVQIYGFGNCFAAAQWKGEGERGR